MEVIAGILSSIACEEVIFAETSLESKKLASKEAFDLYVIHQGERGDLGEALAKELSKDKLTQVLWLVSQESYEILSKTLDNLPIIVLPQPCGRDMLQKYLSFMKVTHEKLKILAKENETLVKKLHDIAFINRAKFILITQLKMNETAAHKYIEKEAMNTRTSKLTVAKKILKTYDF